MSQDAYAALRHANYRHYFAGNFLATVGVQMQSTAVGWDVYVRTQSKLALAWVGLIQFLPVILLFLVSGHVADRYSRRWIVFAAQLVVGVASLFMAIVAYFQWDYRWIYASLLLVGIARAFQQPAKASLLPLLVPEADFPNAVTWHTSGFHLACVVGPALGGLLIKWTESPMVVYLADVCAAAFFATALVTLKVKPAVRKHLPASLAMVAAGLKFLRTQQVVFGAMLLDLFAVLLGGAVTLLPVYAEDILRVGPSGLGYLRTAPAVGAVVTAVIIAHRTRMKHAGRALLLSVAGFGLATIGFGMSRTLGFALLMLFLTGVLDTVSVVIRQTLVQTLTPDELRGRVSAVNSLFIGASNELGGFESGLVAHYFGPVVSVVSGGIGTLLVVGGVGWALPELRKYGPLVGDPKDEQDEKDEPDDA